MPFYPPDRHNPFPWEVSLAFEPGYLSVDPKLLEVIYVDSSKMSDKETSAGRESVEDLAHPFYIPNRGPLNYYIDLPAMHFLDRDRRSITQRWG